MRLILAGILIGLFASYFLTRFLASQIWGVSATDPSTFVAVAALAFFVGVLACFIPARRATRVDSMIHDRPEVRVTAPCSKRPPQPHGHRRKRARGIPDKVKNSYSCRKATIGSTLTARRAGM